MRWPLLSVLALAACGGPSVTMPEGQEDFGTARSAVWLAMPSLDGQGSDHRLIVSDQRDYCGKAEQVFADIAEVYQTQPDTEQLYQDLIDEIGEDDPTFVQELNRLSCSRTKALFAGYAEVTAPLADEGHTLLSLTTKQFPGEEIDTTPVAASYVFIPEDVDEWGPDFYFHGSVRRYAGNPYALGSAAMADVDCEAIDAMTDWYSPVEEAMDGAMGITPLLQGVLELEARGDGFHGELTDGVLNGDVGLQVEATFERCELGLPLDVFLPF